MRPDEFVDKEPTSQDHREKGRDYTSQAVVLVSDAATDIGDPLPPVFERIGEVVHWNQSPSFAEIAAQLDPEREVKPGQFLGVWHGSRGSSPLNVATRILGAHNLISSR